MLNELVYSINAYFTTIPDLGDLPSEAVPLSVVFSIIGALILGKFTGNMGTLTFPINFSAVFIGTTLSNWLLGGIKLEVSNPIQEPLFISMIGMVLASLLMMRWLQSDRARV